MPRKTWVLILSSVSIATIILIIALLCSSPSHRNNPIAAQPSNITSQLSHNIANRDRIGDSPTANGEVLTATISGTVQGPEGPIAGATVYAYLSPDSPSFAEEECGGLRETPPALSLVTTTANGHYTMLLPTRLPPLIVDVGATAAGFTRSLIKNITLAATQPAIDFTLQWGMTIAGQVVDAHGQPVADVPILATTRHYPPETESLMSSWLNDRASLRLPSRDSNYHESRCASGPTGSFSIAGLAPGKYTLVSDSYSWILSPRITVDAGSSGLLLTAMKPLGITGTVSDARSQEPVDKCLVEVAVSDQSGNSFPMRRGSCIRGELALIWLEPDMELASILTLRVRITAPGYEPYFTNVEVSESSNPIAELEARLAPLADGNLRAIVLFASGDACTEPVIVEYAASNSSTKGSVILNKREEPYHVGTLPAGEWFLRIRPESYLSTRLAYRIEASILSDKTTDIEVTLPVSGVLDVHVPSVSVDDTWRLTVTGKSLSTQTILHDIETRFTGFPPGEYSIECSNGDRIRWKGEATLVAGETYQLTVE